MNLHRQGIAINMNLMGLLQGPCQWMWNQDRFERCPAMLSAGTNE
jgi:lauroyl/myristoyl acyltransferase